jgi:hypothetical protein
MMMLAPLLRTIAPPTGGVCDYPAADKVEAGTVYAGGALVGTLAVPWVAAVETGDELAGVIELLNRLSGLVALVGTRIYGGELPEPDRKNGQKVQDQLPCVVVRGIYGTADEYLPVEEPRVQIEALAMTLAAARAVWGQIMAVHQMEGEEAGGVHFHEILLEMGPMDIPEAVDDGETWWRVMGTVRLVCSDA